jgi:hypothetical protein
MTQKMKMKSRRKETPNLRLAKTSLMTLSLNIKAGSFTKGIK